MQTRDAGLDDEWLRARFASRSRGQTRSFAEFKRRVARIGVELHPGARATISVPWVDQEGEAHSGARIDVWWDPRGDAVAETRGLSAYRATAVRVEPEDSEGNALWGLRFWNEIETALYLALAERPVPKERGTLPEPGHAPSIDFYGRLVAEYDALVRDGHPKPIEELAARYGGRRQATVKSWLHRGRKYLKGA